MEYTNVLGTVYENVWYEFSIKPEENVYKVSDQINDYLYIKNYSGEDVELRVRMREEEMTAVLLYKNGKLICNLLRKHWYSDDELSLIMFRDYDEYIGIYLETKENPPLSRYKAVIPQQLSEKRAGTAKKSTNRI